MVLTRRLDCCWLAFLDFMTTVWCNDIVIISVRERATCGHSQRSNCDAHSSSGDNVMELFSLWCPIAGAGVYAVPEPYPGTAVFSTVVYGFTGGTSLLAAVHLSAAFLPDVVLVGGGDNCRAVL